MARLEFIIGRAGTGKTETCLRAMCDAIEREPLGNMLLLLVPEHMTYQAERALVPRTRSRGTMRGFVSGFRRLAWRAAEKGNLPRMTEIGKRLILKKIVGKRAGDLSVLARGAGQRGFTASLAEMIEELKSYHGTPENLKEVASVIDDGYLSKKLEDLALLYGDFMQETEGRFEDAEDRMAKLADAVSGSEEFAGAEVWLDGFVFFNPQEREVLRAFLQTADAVHITLPLGRDVSVHEIIEPSELFYRAAHTLQDLKRMAEEMGISFTVRLLEVPQRFGADAQGIAALERGLFDFPVRAEKGEKSARGVHVTEAATRRLEMEAAGADIIRLCREEGFRWRDVGILLRDSDNYGELLEFTLKEYGIPYFTDRKRAGVHHPLSELIRSALETVTDGWTYDAVFRCVKTDLLPLTNDEADILENYVLEFGIRGETSWKKEWPYLHRNGRTPEAAEAFLQSVNEIRQKAAAPFFRLSDALKAESVREKTRALYDFLVDLHVPETLSNWTEEAKAAGEFEEAKEHRMIWQAAAELFDQMASVSGDEKIALSDYAELLTDGLDALELSLIPQKIDSVTIADFDQNSLNNIRALYILGANDGVMPKSPSTGSLLSDGDRALLAAKKDNIRLELAKTAEEESCGENYLLYHGFTEAREYLWVSYALSDSEGKGIGRSFVVARLLKLLPAIEIDSVPLEGMMREQEEKLLFSAGNRAVSRLVPLLRDYVAAPDESRRGDWGEVYNWALEYACERLTSIRQGLFAGKPETTLSPLLAKSLFTRDNRLSGSVTRFEQYYKCPFSHFAKYGLRLEERAEYVFRSMELGTLLHDVMRRFGEKMHGRKWSSVQEDEIDGFVQRAMEDAIADPQNAILASSAQFQNLAERIKNTAKSSIVRLAEWDGNSDFHPKYYELSFGRGKPKAEFMSWEIPDSGVWLDITGQIDRIDCGEGACAPYFLIVDYKTRDLDLSLPEVYYGLQLQLLTYLEAAKYYFGKKGAAGEKRLVAGVLYCPLKNPIVSGSDTMDQKKADAKFFSELRLTGWLLNDVDIIRNIDRNIGTTSRYLHVRVSNRQNKIYDDDIKRVKTADEFEALTAHTMKMLREAGKKVLSGDAEISPFHLKNKNACKYCPYGDLCGFDEKLKGFSYRELDDTVSFMQEMAGKEGDEDGKGE